MSQCTHIFEIKTFIELVLDQENIPHIDPTELLVIDFWRFKKEYKIILNDTL